VLECGGHGGQVLRRQSALDQGEQLSLLEADVIGEQTT
jgi:hypothetical protein